MSASYYVCQLRDHDGTVTFEAVRSSKLKERLDELKKDYVSAYKAWKAAERETKKAGGEFTDPKPKKPLFRKFLSKKICPKSKADSLASLYQEKWDARMRKKEAAKASAELEDDKKG